jgi:hypothetical protein
MPRILFGGMLSILCAIALVSSAASQQVRPGDRMKLSVNVPRIQASAYRSVSTIQYQGTFQQVSERRLQMIVAAGGSQSFALDSIARVDVQRPRSKGRGALRGAAWGGLSAGLLGFVIGMASPIEDSGPLISEEVDTGLMVGAVLLIPTALVGSLIGLSNPGMRWQSVPVSGLSIGSGQRGFEIGVRLGF